MLALLCVGLLSSCAKEIQFTDGGELSAYRTIEFKAALELSKTSISGEGASKNVHWSEGDVIDIFWDSGRTTAVAAVTGAVTTFRASVPSDAVLYASYPAGVGTLSDGELSVSIPGTVSGKFGDVNMLAARIEQDSDEVTIFHNVASYLKFTVAGGSDADRICISSRHTGEGETPVVTGSWSLSFDERGCVSIGNVTFDRKDIDVMISGDGDYYVPVIPDYVYPDGFSILYYSGNVNTYALDADFDFRLDRACIADFGVVNTTFKPVKVMRYHVTVEGAGRKDGSDWTNAMGKDEFKSIITRWNEYDEYDEASRETAGEKEAALNNAVFHIAGGIYDFGEIVALGFSDHCKRSITFSFDGGYDNNGKKDPENYPTIFSGGNTHNIFKISRYADFCAQDCVFANSRGTSGGDAAIWMDDSHGKLTLDGCTLCDNNNSATAAALSIGKGSACIRGCTFTGNSATYGSAVNVDNGKSSVPYKEVIIENCTFEGNSVSNEAGAIRCASGGPVSITGSKFINNLSSGQGGAIAVKATSSVTLTDCIFSGNTGSYGGAILMDGDSNLSITGGIYSGNYAKGGGLVNQSGNATLNISGGALIKENYATNGHGGAILMGSSGDLVCTGVTFDGNCNNSPSGCWGGAIGTTENGTFTIKDCTFTGNHSKYLGGPAINLQNAINGSISGCTFTGNYSDCTGIADGNNNGNYGGGAMRLNSTGAVNIDNCYFEGNHLVKSSAYNHAYGGAVYINSGGAYKFNGCRFKDNYAVRGGALCAWATNAVIYLNGCGFDGNWISHRYGTTIHVEKAGDFCMNNCSINDNTYTTGGTGDWQAAWVNLSTVTNLCVSNCSFLGSPRTGSSKKISTVNNAIVRFDDLVTDNNKFINNIIVTEVAVGCNRSLANYNKAVKLVYTKRSDNAVNGAGGVQSAEESPAGNGFDNTMFGGLVWDSTDMCWIWNGTMTGGNNRNCCPVSTAVAYLNDHFPSFKTWLDSIGALYRDQLGNVRPASGSWWPGAYQGK